MSVSPSGFCRYQRKAWESNPHDPKVARFSKPARRAVSGYLPKLLQWTHRESNPPCLSENWPPCHSGVFPLDHEPVFPVDRMGVEPITPTLQGSVAPDGMPARSSQRSVRDLNPVFRLTTAACGRNTYRPVLESDPGWNRTSTFLHVTQASLPLDHGIIGS